MSFLDSAGHFTSIMMYFMLESELRKMTPDVILTWYLRYATSYDKIMVILGFSISNYVYLVTFDRNIKLANFQSLAPLLGLSHSKGQGDNRS